MLVQDISDDVIQGKFFLHSTHSEEAVEDALNLSDCNMPNSL